ncbi:MAG: hypothetical protein CK529_01355 [Rhodospirillaceae bacterium]|nr:MAG: hypothetical protein CK529_01355 [Rhodospirillaceae bacterium]
MSSRLSPSPRAKLIRTLVGLAAAMAITLGVFLLVAAFAGAMRVMNEITNNMPLRCPDGYDLIALEDGSPGCTAKPPPPVMGVVSVTLPKLTEKPVSSTPSAQASPAAQPKSPKP